GSDVCSSDLRQRRRRWRSTTSTWNNLPACGPETARCRAECRDTIEPRRKVPFIERSARFVSSSKILNRHFAVTISRTQAPETGLPDRFRSSATMEARLVNRTVVSRSTRGSDHASFRLYPALPVDRRLRSTVLAARQHERRDTGLSALQHRAHRGERLPHHHGRGRVPRI